MTEQATTFVCECCERVRRFDAQVTGGADLYEAPYCDVCNTDSCSPTGEYCELNEYEVAAVFNAPLDEDAELADLRWEQLLADAQAVVAERSN